VDKGKMIAAIVERLKIRLDEDDPAFILVELNKLALEESVKNLVEQFGGLEALPSQLLEIQADLAAAGDTAAGRLNKQTFQLLAAAEKIERLVRALADEANRNIVSNAMETKKTLTIEMGIEAKEAVATCVDKAVTNKIKESIKLLDEAGGRLDASADAIGRASWRGVAWVGFASFLAATLVVCAQWFLGPSSQNIAALSPANAALIKKGRDFEKVLLELDAKTRAKIELRLATQE